MRFPASLPLSLAVAALSLCAALPLSAQESSSQTQTQTPPVQQPAPSYVVIDPLAGVRYDNRYDITLAFAYDHAKAGPNLLQGANLGGLDLSASYWLTRHWGAEGSVRPYVGTSGAAPNTFLNSKGSQDSIQGPFVAQYFFVGGPEFLGPHNKHGDLTAHVLVGGVYGQFERDLRGQSPQLVGFYNDQIAPAVIMGGHLDLNRSAHWTLRLTPDAILTDYSTNYGSKNRQFDVNAAFSVGIEYKFKKTR
ncbi:MAG TPA: hypothetical protein VG267_10365 [Terracidiphilus sp.]|jgi:hypothetical protein|nr:hypothetical protein [Terracidiphilus sp.]